MERAEKAAGRLDALSADEGEAGTRTADVERARDEAFAAIDADAERLGQERAELIDGLPADLLALYEKLRGSEGGVGAAPIRQRRCEGCRLELDISEVNHIRASPDDEVLRCESCRRIIVRTPESGL